MKLERLCSDANEIESGVEVDDNDGFVCEVKDESVPSMLYGAWIPFIEIKESHYLKM